MILPFPSRTLCRLLSHCATVDLGTGDTPGAMELARDKVIKDGEEDLDKHSNAHGDEDLGRIVQTAETIDQAGLGLRIGRSIDKAVAMLGILALKLGDVQETSIGGVEKSDTTREIGSHDPVLGVSGQKGANHGAELADPPVKMKKND